MSTPDGPVGTRLAGPPPRRTLVLAALTLAVLAGALFIRLGMWETPPGRSLDAPPAEIVGVWVTDDPRYVGRAMEILEDRIVFHVGEEEPRVHAIRAVYAEGMGTRLAVTLVYESPGGETTLEATVGNLEPQTLRLQHQEEVAWTRGTVPGAMAPDEGTGREDPVETGAEERGEGPAEATPAAAPR